MMTIVGAEATDSNLLDTITYTIEHISGPVSDVACSINNDGNIEIELYEVFEGTYIF
jgi:hypothetical protein